MRTRRLGEALTLAGNVIVIGLAIYLVAFWQGAVRGNPESAADMLAHRAAAALVLDELTTWEDRTEGAGAALRVLVFSDYQCASCREAHRVLKEAGPDLGVEISYRHLPLFPIHPYADPAARAAICAEAQGRFAAMNDLLFENQASLGAGEWMSLAMGAGVADTMAFNECLQHETTTRRLRRDLAMAELLGLRGVPTFVGPGGVHVGVATPDIIRSIGGRTPAAGPGM